MDTEVEAYQKLRELCEDFEKYRRFLSDPYMPKRVNPDSPRYFEKGRQPDSIIGYLEKIRFAEMNAFSTELDLKK